MFALQNLSSINVIRCEAPWEFKGAIPDHVRADKKGRDTWMTAPATRHNAYSFIEGLNPNRRITADKDENSNPPYRIHGFVADYDAPISDEDALKALETFTPKPQYVERTLSGYLRLVWRFESPMLVPSDKFLKFFLKGVLEFFPVDKLLPGFDMGAWVEPNRYYTNSCDWREIEGAKPVPVERLKGWMVQVGTKFGWTKEADATEIPLNVIQEALDKKYPRFSEWPGEFSLHAQGPSFWVDDSTSPKSAIVRETGMQTFSAHAAKGFYSWADLLDHAFTQSYKADNLGRAVEDIYFDGRSYWRKDPGDRWSAWDYNRIRDHLQTTRKLNPKRDKVTCSSDIDRAMEYIHDYQKVEGAGPFIFRPPGVIRLYDSGKSFLNICNTRVLAPSGQKEVWGPEGNFPWLSRFLDLLFDPVWQKEWFLAWWKVYYESGHFRKPTFGHAVFLVGPSGVGKSLLSKIVGTSVGGYVDATQFLLGNDSFNSELWEFAHWAIDDAVFGTTFTSKRHFSEMVKAIVANESFRCNEKFKKATRVLWQGRAMVTLNDDLESLRAIPDLGISILDKLMLFRATKDIGFEFPPSEEIDRIIAAELPHFLQWLLDMQIPDEVRGPNRFTVRAYHEPTLMQTAEQSSATAGFLEILEDWKQEYFEIREPKAEVWQGTGTQLYKEFLVDTRSGVLLRHLTADRVGQLLAQLKIKGHNLDWEEDENTGTRRWTIYKSRTAKEINSESESY